LSVAVKICGLSEPDAVAAAVAGGAAFLGFAFYPPSPRHVAAAVVAELCRAVPAGVIRVGLFVDPDDATIASVLEAAPLDFLQFHGGESPARVAEVRRRFARPVMKALPIACPEDVAAVDAYLGVADRLLFDARPPRRADALPGGNGLVFDWRLIAGRRWSLPWMLSGGLTAANVAEAVRLTGAAAVDVSSGVESAPGLKDPAKIAAFLAAAGANPNAQAGH
jgi:phosphoribosylanthranilate isomerase